MWHLMIQVCLRMTHHMTVIPAASQQPAATCEELFESETGQVEPFPSKASAA